MPISKEQIQHEHLPGVTKKIFLEMANQNYLLTLRFLCVFMSWRLRIFTPEDSGQWRKDFANNPKHIWLNVFMQYFLVGPRYDRSATDGLRYWT
jgi:hypothetical protein